MSKIQKENLFFFLFSNASNFGEAKVTKKREQNKRNFSFLCRDEVISQCFQAKLLKRLEIKDERSEFFAIFGAMY